jgi:N-acetylmuramoyl-L-alanine amidase
MEVRNHKIAELDYLPSPNLGGGLKPTLIVIHFTAGPSLESASKTLRDPKPANGKRVSAHAILGRDGKGQQLVPFNRIAWHAGPSSWHGKESCNGFAIGLELENVGFLRPSATGWRPWFGGPDLDPADYIKAKHKNGGPEMGWQKFPEAQVSAAYLVCEALIDAYPTIVEVAGHDDIAPLRKRDPGPAFDMDKFRSWLFDRGQG